MQPSQISHKKILFAALNWGLGHVMRSIPLLQELQKAGNTIVIACDEEQKLFFEAELSNVQYEFLKGYSFRFGGKGNFGMDLLRSFFRLHKDLKHERKIVAELVKKHQIDTVISDQRLGFYNLGTKNILISHQLTLLVPFHLRMINLYYHHYTKKFDFIWVPDAQERENRITGKLSHSKSKNIHFIGFLSRFQTVVSTKKYLVGAIISGPPPYNQQLMDIVLKEFKSLDKASFIISPTVENEQIGNITLVKYTSSQQMSEWLTQTEYIISRSGYSTIMDLKILGIKGILIPTPGQYEQIYLAEQLKNDVQFHVVGLNGVCLEDCFSEGSV